MRVGIVAQYLFFEKTGFGGGYNGAAIAHCEFYRALLAHGDAEAYLIFTGDMTEARAFLETVSETARARVSLYHMDRLPGVLAEGGCDLLHTTGPHLYPLARLRRRFARRPLPVCNTILSSLSYQQLFPNYEGELWPEFYSFDCVVHTTEAIKRAWQEMLGRMAGQVGRALPPIHHQVIPLGIDTQRFRPRDRSSARQELGLPVAATLALSLSRLTPMDKMDLIPVLMAFEREVVRQPRLEDIHLVIAGENNPFSYAQVVQAYIDTRGLQERVRLWPSPESDVTPLLYAASDIFIAPYDSLQENFGQTVIEAQASGLPVVGSDWGPLRETIAAGETGVLVPTYWASCADTLSDLAPFLELKYEQLYLGQSVAIDMVALWQAVVHLARDHEQRSQFGTQARLRAEREYDWQPIIARYNRLWQELCREAEQDHSPPPGPGPPYFPDYFAAYQHYPRHLVDDRTEVRLTRMGHELLPHQNLVPTLHYMSHILSPVRINGMLRACYDWTPLARLLADSQGEEQRQRALYHVLWLLKYGLLEPRQPPAPGQE